MIKGVAFTPDGTFAITGGNLLRVWDMKTGEVVHKLRESGGLVHCVACSPTGMRFASGSADAKVRIWDLNTARSILVLKGHVGAIFSVSFSPTGQQLASGGKDGTIRLWSAESGVSSLVLRNCDEVVKKSAPPRPRAVKTIVYSLDGIWICSGGVDGVLRLWNTTTGDLQHRFKVNDTEIASVAFSPQGGQIAAGCNDATVRLVNTHTGEAGRVMQGHEDDVTSVVYLSGGTQVASGCLGGLIKLWNVESGDMTAELGISITSVKWLAFCPTSQRLAAGCGDDTVRFWSITSNTSSSSVSSTAAFSPNGLQVVSSADGNVIQLWSADDGTRTHVMTGHTDFIDSFSRSMSLSATISPIIVEESKGFQCISMMPSKYNSHIRPVMKYLRRYLNLSTAETEYSWKEMLDGLDKEGAPDMDLIKFQTGTISNESNETKLFTPKITDFMEKVLGASVTPKSKETWDTQLTTIFNNLPMTRSNSLWNITSSANGSKTGYDYSLFLQYLVVSHIALWAPSSSPSSDGQQVASASRDGSARLWSTKTSETIHKLEHDYGFVISVVYFPNGEQVITGGSDGTLQIWDSRSGKSGAIIKDEAGFATNPIFSPTGRQIAMANNDFETRLWSTSGDPGVIMRGHTDVVTSIAYSRSGLKLVSSSMDMTIRLWIVTVANGATEPDVLVLKSHAEVTCVIYAPNGRLIASGSKDATVRFWDGVDGTPTYILAGHSGAITSIAFSPDSLMIAIGSEDKTMRLWDVTLGRHLTTVGDFVVGIKSIGWRATLDAFYLVTGCKKNPVCVWQVIRDGEQYDIRRVWNSESDRLAVSGADVQNVNGLNSNNLNLSIQLGAIFLSVEAAN
ncbi:hypothetical protein BGW39_001124 [Mortierella sp. 14UC]|nr:hypothetical protein BGW39_001124 [Mortierella sp. 14UC]